jgi:hypothetical protein
LEILINKQQGDIAMFKTNKSFHSVIAVLAGLILISSLFLSASAAAALGATSTDMPLHFLRSADCTDEVVEISGTVHLVNQVQTDGSVIGHFNYQNVSGVGLTSGTTYQTSAVDHFRLSAPFPSSVSSMQSFRLIGRGFESNLLVTVLYHVTVNANGEVAASIDDLSMQCTP